MDRLALLDVNPSCKVIPDMFTSEHQFIKWSLMPQSTSHAPEQSTKQQPAGGARTLLSTRVMSLSCLPSNGCYLNVHDKRKTNVIYTILIKTFTGLIRC